MLAALALLLAAPVPDGAVPIRSLPFVIAEPGLYVLESDLEIPDEPPPGAEAGITILADGVTLDLRDHRLVGGESGLHGVRVERDERDPDAVNVTIRNGTIQGWGGHGVEAARASASRFERLVLLHNGKPGKAFHGLLAGDDCRVVDCTARSNAWYGISVGSGCTVTDTVCSKNGATGLRAGGGSLVRDCLMQENVGNGFEVGPSAEAITVRGSAASWNRGSGFVGGFATVFEACTAHANRRHGYELTGAGLVRDCVGSSNLVVGVSMTGPGNRVEGNHLVRNRMAFVARDGRNLVLRNTAVDNARPDETHDDTVCPMLALGVDPDALPWERSESPPPPAALANITFR